MANQKQSDTEDQAETPQTTSGRRSMTPEQAKKRGLDPAAYGKASDG